MVKPAALLAGAGLILLGACARVGPDYHVPPTAMVKAPAAQGPFVAAGPGTRNDPLPDHWWRLFDDPRLDTLIETALAANTDLRVAEANLQRTQALLRDRETRRQVQGGFSAETEWTQRSAEQVLSHTQPSEKETYDLGLSVSYDLDLFGALHRGIEAASADSEAAQAARDLVRVNVAAETARDWADLCNAGHQADVLRSVIARQEAGLALTRETVRHGRAAPYEIERRESMVETARARLPGLIAAQREALFRLTAMTGRPPAQADPSLLRCHTPLTLKQAIPVGDGQALLARRPDIRLAERRLAATTARIGVATAALYPDISLGGAIGSTGAATDMVSPLTNRFTVGPSIHWTLNRSGVRARIAATQAQGEADLAAFDGTVLKALREVEVALTAYGADIDRQRDLAHARDDARDVAAHLGTLRKGGRIGGLPAVEADRDALLAEEAVAAGQATLNADQMRLFLALGGGWTRPAAL
ncbi:RND efflux system outer membrane lipoprotein [Novosphingobium nitrogenifigens DSM 19370]|uniref:RND efflux system outer membrane lipoprotein n=1 Tax=Novosphingobium nitrogenifigens DSM 19370 TaxID=983920 RepID=F1ZBL4_9SPHN|nr:efflux transporter outer membrane subunit [Novosphingobium nitrogenifigens]EGD57901.1 RND efflux system outer membrane lipoprotein [Novosphingobium nitrogenifigens DSM 19370]